MLIFKKRITFLAVEYDTRAFKCADKSISDSKGHSRRVLGLQSVEFIHVSPQQSHLIFASWNPEVRTPFQSCVICLNALTMDAIFLNFREIHENLEKMGFEKKSCPVVRLTFFFNLLDFQFSPKSFFSVYELSLKLSKTHFFQKKHFKIDGYKK